MIILDWILKSHPKVKEDIKLLDDREKKIVRNAIDKIKENPLRYKHLTVYKNAYRLRAGKIRIVYLIKENTIWILIIEKRSKIYGSLPDRYKSLKI